MAFKKNTTTIVDSQPVRKALQTAQRKPKTWLFVFALIPLVLLGFWTVKSGWISSKPAKEKPISFNTNRQTPQELAEEATLALRKGDTFAFFELLNTKIKDPNIVNSHGDSLLLEAATLGNLEAVQSLIAMGADINQQNYNTRDTAVLRSVYMGHDEITQLLVYEHADLNLANNYRQTPMGLAVENQKGNLVDLFLSYGGVKSGLDSDTLLRSSAQKNRVGVLAMLKGGIDPNVSNEQGNTPLIISASLGDTDNVRTLLAYRADVNAANKEGNTAVIYAARFNHPETLLALFAPLTMQYRADINAQNNKGETALYWAAAKGYAPVVKILLAYDAKRDLKTKEGLTALDIAQKYKRQEVIDLFNMNPNQLKASFNEEQRARQEAANLAARTEQAPSEEVQ